MKWAAEEGLAEELDPVARDVSATREEIRVLEAGGNV
jgi:hypothetical protein